MVSVSARLHSGRGLKPFKHEGCAAKGASFANPPGVLPISGSPRAFETALVHASVRKAIGGDGVAVLAGMIAHRNEVGIS